MPLHPADATADRAVTRRGVCTLLAGGAAALAGCGLLAESQPDVTVFNSHDSAVEATLVVSADRSTVVSATETVDPDDPLTRDGVLPDSGSVTVTVGVPEGPGAERTFDAESVTAIRAWVESEAIEFETS